MRDRAQDLAQDHPNPFIRDLLLNQEMISQALGVPPDLLGPEERIEKRHPFSIETDQTDPV